MMHLQQQSMKYLLIDFGATYVKCAVYNKDTQDFEKTFTHTSPFKEHDKVSKETLLNILSQMIAESGNVDGVVVCTILGGGYIGNVYHSWKSPHSKLQECDRTHCMISGLFNSTVHYHHKPVRNSFTISPCPDRISCAVSVFRKLVSITTLLGAENNAS